MVYLSILFIKIIFNLPYTSAYCENMLYDTKTLSNYLSISEYEMWDFTDLLALINVYQNDDL